MVAKSQAELEQPAKVYQLNAVETKLDTALDKLKTIVDQTAGLVTTNQLEDAKKIAKEYVDEEIKKVHLTYGPVKTRTNNITNTLIAAVVLQLIYIIFNLFGGK